LGSGTVTVVRAGGIIRKEFRKKAVEFRTVGDIADKHGGVYDQVETATSSQQNGFEILERLPGLEHRT
jgi:hypothetical protein